jgi:hypothetical protein
VLTEQQRLAHMRRSKLRKLGKPSIVDPTPGILHVRKLVYRHGMGAAQIAEAAGCSTSLIWEYLNGYRTKDGPTQRPLTRTRRTSLERILSVQPEPVDMDRPLRSARVPPHGTVRRLQALIYDGYPGKLLAEHMKCHNQRLNFLVNSPQSFIYTTTAIRARELYDKLDGVDPADLGVTVFQQGRARGAARRHGYAPRSCWDDDTIDDPNAVPEWTGACGTEAGRRIHQRDGIPLCDACRTARRGDNGAHTG